MSDRRPVPNPLHEPRKFIQWTRDSVARKITAPKISDATWEGYKDEILREYFAGGRRGHSRAQQYMRKQHGFKASTSQWNYRLYTVWEVKKLQPPLLPHAPTTLPLHASLRPHASPPPPRSPPSLRDQAPASHAEATGEYVEPLSPLQDEMEYSYIPPSMDVPASACHEQLQATQHDFPWYHQPVYGNYGIPESMEFSETQESPMHFSDGRDALAPLPMEENLWLARIESLAPSCSTAREPPASIMSQTSISESLGAAGSFFADTLYDSANEADGSLFHASMEDLPPIAKAGFPQIEYSEPYPARPLPDSTSNHDWQPYSALLGDGPAVLETSLVDDSADTEMPTTPKRHSLLKALARLSRSSNATEVAAPLSSDSPSRRRSLMKDAMNRLSAAFSDKSQIPPSEEGGNRSSSRISRVMVTSVGAIHDEAVERLESQTCIQQDSAMLDAHAGWTGSHSRTSSGSAARQSVIFHPHSPNSSRSEARHSALFHHSSNSALRLEASQSAAFPARQRSFRRAASPLPSFSAFDDVNVPEHGEILWK